MQLVRTIFLLQIFALFLSPAPPSIAGETVHFLRQGQPIKVNGVSIGEKYTDTHDAQLRERKPDTNFDTGSVSDSRFTIDGSDPRFSDFASQVVMRFGKLFGDNPGQILPGSKIHSATLFLNIDNRGDDISIFQIAETVTWDEASVTWNNFGTGNGGFTIHSEATGTPLVVSGDGDKTDVDITSIVSAWSQGAANRGIAFIPGSGNGVDFNTSETQVATERPSLTIRYTPFNPLAPIFTADRIDVGAASATNPFTGNIVEFAADSDGDTLTFSKTSGPDWVIVGEDGSLSGTPEFDDMGRSTVTVSVTDDDGSASTTLTIAVNDPDGNPPPPFSRTGKYRLAWVSNPDSTITIGWEQITGAPGTVYFGTEDEGRLFNNYPNIQGIDRTINFRDMNNCFARLSGLLPDTRYYFVIRDASGISERFWFRTAPSTIMPFTFVAGGDSRNNRGPRQRANRMVAKLRPLFVVFTGDMIDSDKPIEWRDWLDDWQETITADRRIIPILPHRGNHETGGNEVLCNLFDITTDNYYALSFGGVMLRYYVLNSEMVEGGAQAAWLERDLAKNASSHIHLAAGYHKPMRPHTSSKSEGSDEYDAWARIFFDYGVDLAIESDSHTVKRTWPLEPSTGDGNDEGFIRNDGAGTVFIGEGSWGAPLRAANDRKEWTIAGGSFNGFDLIHVHPDRMEEFTIRVDYEPFATPLLEGEQLVLPSGTKLWNPPSGAMLMVGSDPASVEQSWAAWQARTFGGSIPAGAGPFADFDKDGLLNCAERILGRDPICSDNDDPPMSLRLEKNGITILDYSRAPRVGGSIDIQYSDDRVNFSSLEEGIDYKQTTSMSNELESVRAEIFGPEAPPGAETRYYRLLIKP